MIEIVETKIQPPGMYRATCSDDNRTVGRLSRDPYEAAALACSALLRYRASSRQFIHDLHIMRERDLEMQLAGTGA